MITALQETLRGLVMTGMAKLSRAILSVLLSGRHAALGGRSSRDRATNLAPIASAYSRAELEAEEGIGPARATAVEHWLTGQGLSLRDEHTCSKSGIAGADMVSVSNSEQVVGSAAR